MSTIGIMARRGRELEDASLLKVQLVMPLIPSDDTNYTLLG